MFVLQVIETGSLGARRSVLLDDLAARASYAVDLDVGRWYTFVTATLLHADGGHIFFNMLAFLIFALPLEERIGRVRLLILYVSTAFAAVPIHAAWMYVAGVPLEIPIVGASGAVFGVMLAYAMLFPHRLVSFYFIFPMRATTFVLLCAALVQFDALPAGVLRWWLRSESLLLLLSLVSLLAGGRLLWWSDHAPADWSPRRSGVRFHSVVLYTRAGCHLCDEAREVIGRPLTLIMPEHHRERHRRAFYEAIQRRGAPRPRSSRRKRRRRGKTPPSSWRRRRAAPSPRCRSPPRADCWRPGSSRATAAPRRVGTRCASPRGGS